MITQKTVVTINDFIPDYDKVLTGVLVETTNTYTYKKEGKEYVRNVFTQVRKENEDYKIVLSAVENKNLDYIIETDIPVKDLSTKEAYETFIENFVRNHNPAMEDI